MSSCIRVLHADGEITSKTKFVVEGEPLFTLTINKHSKYSGLTRKKAAKLAGILLSSEEFSLAEIVSEPAKGEWVDVPITEEDRAEAKRNYEARADG